MINMVNVLIIIQQAMLFVSASGRNSQLETIFINLFYSRFGMQVNVCSVHRFLK